MARLVRIVTAAQLSLVLLTVFEMVNISLLIPRLSDACQSTKYIFVLGLLASCLTLVSVASWMLRTSKFNPLKLKQGLLYTTVLLKCVYGLISMSEFSDNNIGLCYADSSVGRSIFMQELFSALMMVGVWSITSKWSSISS